MNKMKINYIIFSSTKTNWKQYQDLVLLLQVPDDYVIDRIIGRFQCAHCGTLYHEKFKQTASFGICDECGCKEFTRRADDTYETVVSRLRTFRSVTAPVIPYYEQKGLLVCVDGTGPIDVVSEKIRKIVGYWFKTWHWMRNTV